MHRLALAMAAALVLPASAQKAEDDIRLDTITVTDLRPVAPDDATASVSVLDADALAIRDPAWLADELRSVPGVAVSRSGGLGSLTQVRIRGAEANHTLVLVDGVEVSDPVTGETDFGLLAGLGTQRIEIARGEQSALYGSDAIGGVIAVTTGGAGLSGAVEAGRFDTQRGTLGVYQQGETLRGGVSLAGARTDGVDTSGRGGETDGSRSAAALASATLRLGPDWTLGGIASLRRTYSAFDADLDFDGRLDNADRETESDQTLAGLSLAGSAFELDHILRASFNRVERENTADGAFTDRTLGERTKLAWSPSREIGLGAGRLLLSGLLDWEREDYERLSLDTLYGDPNQSQRFDSFGLAGEARLALGALDLSASARHDNNDDRFADATTWRLGAGWQTGSWGRLRASMGTGIKNPTFTEMFGYYPGSFIGNPDLEPERSTGWEIGWDVTLGGLVLSLTGFEARLDDEIVTAFNPDFTATAINRAGKSERSGIEAAARWPLTDALTLTGQFTCIDSDAADGTPEIRVPSTTASLALDWRADALKPGARFGLALDHVGEQDDFDFAAWPARRVTLDAYTLASATLAWPLSERIALTLRGDNLLDERVTDVYGYEGPGAGLYVGVKLR